MSVRHQVLPALRASGDCDDYPMLAVWICDFADLSV